MFLKLMKRNMPIIVIISIVISVASSTILSTKYIGDEFLLEQLKNSSGRVFEDFHIEWEDSLTFNDYLVLKEELYSSSKYLEKVTILTSTGNIFIDPVENKIFKLLGFYDVGDLNTFIKNVTMIKNFIGINECLIPYEIIDYLGLRIGDYIELIIYPSNKTMRLKIVGTYGEKLRSMGYVGILDEYAVVVNATTMNLAKQSIIVSTHILLKVNLDTLWVVYHEINMIKRCLVNIRSGIISILEAHNIDYQISSPLVSGLENIQTRLESLYLFIELITLVITLIVSIMIGLFFDLYIDKNIREFSILKKRGGARKFFFILIPSIYIVSILLSSLLNMFFVPVLVNLISEYKVGISWIINKSISIFVTSLTILLIGSILVVVYNIKAIFQKITVMEKYLAEDKEQIRGIYLIGVISGVITYALTVQGGYIFLNTMLYMKIHGILYQILIALERIFIWISPIIFSISLTLIVLYQIIPRLIKLISRKYESFGLIFKVFSSKSIRIRAVLIIDIISFLVNFFIINWATGNSMVLINSKFDVGGDLAIYFNRELPYNTSTCLNIQEKIDGIEGIVASSMITRGYYKSELIDDNIRINVGNLTGTIIFYGVSSSHFDLEYMREYSGLKGITLDNNSVILTKKAKKNLGESEKLSIRIEVSNVIHTFNLTIKGYANFLPGISSIYSSSEDLYLILNIDLLDNIFNIINKTLYVKKMIIDTNEGAPYNVVKNAVLNLLFNEGLDLDSDDVSVITLNDYLTTTYGDYLYVSSILIGNLNYIILGLLLFSFFYFTIQITNKKRIDVVMLRVRGVSTDKINLVLDTFMLLLLITIIIPSFLGAVLFVYSIRLDLNILVFAPLVFEVPPYYLLTIPEWLWEFHFGVILLSILFSKGYRAYIMEQDMERIIRWAQVEM